MARLRGPPFKRKKVPDSLVLNRLKLIEKLNSHDPPGLQRGREEERAGGTAHYITLSGGTTRTVKHQSEKNDPRRRDRAEL